MAKKIIDRCPHCGSDWGIYTKIDYLRVRADYGFDGEEQFNLGDIADCAEERREGKTAYCQKCNKSICHLSTIKKQWNKGIVHPDSNTHSNQDELNQLGGQTIIFDSLRSAINPLDVRMNDVERDHIKRATDFIIYLCNEALSPDSTLSTYQVSLIERCVEHLYEPYFDSLNEQTGEYDESKIPTMKDFDNLLRAQVGFDSYVTVTALEDFISDSLPDAAGVEAGQNTQQLGDQIKGFPFYPEALKEALPDPSVISDERAMTLFWWWSIDMANGCKGKTWRSELTQEERMLVETWDASTAWKE